MKSHDVENITQNQAIRALVGYHHYFMMDISDARDRVKSSLRDAGLTGWSVFVGRLDSAIPDGAIRVGQVKVHSGACAFPLYVGRI
jgi:hypothetical protein